jgi:peptide/nickel transport system permease protein
MNYLRRAAACVLAGVFAAALFPGLLTSASYDRQFREAPNAPVSRQFPLGTDELGRDRLARLLYGTRISLIAAPAVALLSTVVAALVGGLAGFLGGWIDRCCVACIDLMLSLPWLFLLIIVRALLPLNLSPQVSVLVTFGLIAVLGWAPAARVVRAACRSLRCSDLVLEARSCGVPERRILWKYVLPNARPVLLAQFRASVPLYILAEANLGLLGLGVADPIPTWGNLLRPLEGAFAPEPAAWAPLALMLVAVSCMYVMQRATGRPGEPGQAWRPVTR